MENLSDYRKCNNCSEYYNKEEINFCPYCSTTPEDNEKEVTLLDDIKEAIDNI